MANEDIELYRHWLACSLENDKTRDKNYVQESFMETIQKSPAYQSNSVVNGGSQPIVATRKETKKCKITVLPGDTLRIGDLVQVFNEYWICMELYTDEFGMSYGELWMCNQIFKYQDDAGDIIEKHAVMDDGSYSKGNDKAISVTNNCFTCYMSLDNESDVLFVDKRLAIDSVKGRNGEEILEVGKIVWLDTKSKNFGEGSHLLAFGIGSDVYNKEKDRKDLMICDYCDKGIITKETDIPIASDKKQLKISGREEIRIGTDRTYKALSIDSSGDTQDIYSAVVWSISEPIDGIELMSDGAKCVVRVPLKDNLIGKSFRLNCSDLTGQYIDANKIVEVISFG